MTQQEEIREMKSHIGSLIIQGQAKETDKLWPTVDAIFAYLDSKGVVIKVDREWPDIEEYCHLIQDFSDHTGRMSGYRSAQQDMTEAGYVAVERLIKEG